MTPAIQLLQKHKLSHKLHRYEHDPASTAYADEAASLLGVAPQRVFKTLLLARSTAAAKLCVALVPACNQLDLKLLAKVVGEKSLKLADSALAETASGYVVGGISPLGQKKRWPTVIDESAQQHQTIFVSGGRRGLEIELAAVDLAALLDARFAAVAR